MIVCAVLAVARKEALSGARQVGKPSSRQEPGGIAEYAARDDSNSYSGSVASQG